MNQRFTVGPFEFFQVVNINPGHNVAAVHTFNHDTVCINGFNDTAVFCNLTGAGITRHFAFDTGPDQRGFDAQQRHGLALHVRTHQRTVGVVRFNERNQTGCDGHNLTRFNVD